MIFKERGNRGMKRNEIHNGEAAAEPVAVSLDVRAIIEQLGIDPANWPQDLPPLTAKENHLS
jgi:hypothetical protein